MKSVDAGLAHLPYTGRGVAWPSGGMVDIDMSSPDATGAVAYYFDTLSPEDPGPQRDRVSWAGAGAAAAQYLLGLVKTKGLEVTRGPYLTEGPQSDLLPSGWRMLRVLIWVEEFDLVVPDEPEYAVVRVNGRAYELTLAGREIDHAKVCELAGVPQYATVTYRNAAARGRGEGTLTVGESIRVKTSGTVFDAVVTSNA